MSVRCKFRCMSVTKTEHWSREAREQGRFLYSAKFCAVTADSDENRAFFEATPSGTLEIGTYKEDTFEVGREYYLDLSPAAELEPAPAAREGA